MIEYAIWIFAALLAGEGPVKLFGLWPTLIVGSVLAIGLVGMARDAVRALRQWWRSRLSSKERMVLTLLGSVSGLAGVSGLAAVELIERSHGALRAKKIYSTLCALEDHGYVDRFYTDTWLPLRYYITEDGMAALDKASVVS